MQARLTEYDAFAVEQYARYVIKLQTEKKKEGGAKNPWANYKKLDDWVAYFEKVAATGFFIDGENITIGSNGISLNYQAYKNLVIKKYPEAVFDMQLVKEGEEFTFSKENGKVIYKHTLNNPFSDSKIIGGYCIIKMRSGEFIELLSLKDLEQIRRTAKTDYIWKQWTSEMYLKTIIKRACKRHFKDAVERLDNMDNENYQLSREENEQLDEETEGKINKCTTNKELLDLWLQMQKITMTKKQRTMVIEACTARKVLIKGADHENI